MAVLPRPAAASRGLGPAAVFWLGFSFWRGHLGASLDRDFASPGLLGVRWDGPAGGTTFRDPVAEPRPGFRSRAYVSGPSAGGGAKVAAMTQGGNSDETSPGHRARLARNSRRKKSKVTPPRVDLEQISITRSHEPEGRVSAKTASRICYRATASTHGTSTDFSPPSEAGRRPCRSPDADRPIT